MTEQKAESKPGSTIGIRLTPVEHSDQPKLANFARVQPASGLAYIDFGFIEPGAFPALARAAKAGKEMPAAINGKLTARIALTQDSVQSLHEQLGRLLAARVKDGPKTK